MTNYDDGDENVDNDGNEGEHDDDNAASRSGSDDPIFDPITTPRSHGEALGNDLDGAASVAHYVSTCWSIYLPYKNHIKDVP